MQQKKGNQENIGEGKQIKQTEINKRKKKKILLFEHRHLQFLKIAFTGNFCEAIVPINKEECLQISKKFKIHVEESIKEDGRR